MFCFTQFFFYDKITDIRESMKILSRILAICLCSAPLIDNAAWGVVASTSGHNLTAFNPSTANNNQWATASNGRQEVAPTAKADFGNCNSVVLRCAQPKCANGGCVDLNIATGIVAGCVQTNKACIQYGNELVSYMAAQLVASSTAKANAQNAEAAQNAAATQSAQTQQQMQQMQQQMQSQLAQMQQQNMQTQQQLQQALQQQQEQNALMMQNMQAAANAAADAAANANASVNAANASISQVTADMSTGVGQTTGSGLTGYQMDAVDRSASIKALERQEIGNQVMAEMKDADLALKKVKTAMNNSFEYAGCDSHGNSCTGPKRIKKWRELAMDFVDPYDEVVDKLYDAIETAMFVGGIDLSNIYMMLGDSCEKWGEFMCEPGSIEYRNKDKNGKEQNGVPYSCGSVFATCKTNCDNEYTNGTTSKGNVDVWSACREKCFFVSGACNQCRQLKVLTDRSDVYNRWTQSDPTDTTSNTTVVACMDNVMSDNKLFSRRNKRRKGNDVVDLEDISTWLSQTESVTSKSITDKEYLNYCNVKLGSDGVEVLQTAVAARAINKDKYPLCVKELGKTDKVYASNDNECPFINPIYAICDTHAYNNGQSNPSSKASERDEVKEVIGLKVTVLSQQLYKQYEYLAATLRRLQTQLKKSVFSANLEAAGLGSGDDSSSGTMDEDRTIYLPGAENCWNASSPDKAYDCMINNINLIKSNVNTNAQKAGKQLAQTVAVARQWDIDPCKDKRDKDNNKCPTNAPCSKYQDNNYASAKKEITECANNLQVAVVREKSKAESDKNRYQRDRW